MTQCNHGPRTVPHSRGPLSFVAAILLLLSSNSMAAGDPMAAIQRILDLGTPGLAMALIERKQQNLDTHSDDWWRLEMQRLGMLEQDGRWEDISTRTAGHDNVPDHFLGYVVALHARSMMKQGNANDARIYLQKFLFAGKGSAEDQARWQRLLVETHIQERRYQAARNSLLKYSQGVVQDQAWVLLHARVLMLLGKHADAHVLLAEPTDPLAKSYALLATLRKTPDDDTTSLDNILRDARRQARNDKLSLALRARYWYIVGQAALLKHDLARSIVAHEIYLAYALRSSLDDAVFAFSPDELWQLYDTYAEQIAAGKLLLKGDWPAWQALAGKVVKVVPASARALHAYVARHAGGSELAEVSHKQLWKLLTANDYGMDTLYQLYMRSLSYTIDRRLPLIIRHVLINRALKQQDYKQASQWLQGLDAPPDNMDDFAWALHRARIHVYAGNLEQATQLLAPVLERINTLEEKQVDQIMQVIFDMQANGRHDSAIALFRQLLQVATDTKLLRELHYWLADSYRGEQRYVDAAYEYLLSALQDAENHMDMWGQSAYYQAAGALARAGLHHDAMVIYQNLLTVTDDLRRKQILQDHIRRLRMQNQRDDDA